MKKESPFIFIPNNNFENKTQLFIDHTGLLIYQPIPTNVEWKDCIYQHLYILSDDDKKDGDWVIYSKEVHQVTSNPLNFKIDLDCNSDVDINDCRKIIATTNPELSSKVAMLLNKVHPTFPSISQSDIEYIISLYNGKDKSIDVEGLSSRYKHLNEWKNLTLAHKLGYDECLQDNADKIDIFFDKQLAEFRIMLKEAKPPTKQQRKLYMPTHQDRIIIQCDMISYLKLMIQSYLKKEQPKNHTIMVEYENICIQTGIPCGMPCIGNCDEITTKRPTVDKEGNIIIVR